MSTQSKDFKVKNGLIVGGNGIFDGTVTTDAVQLDTSLNLTPAVGQVSWNQDFETLNVGLDADVTLQVGQEHLIRVKNNSGSVAIPNFTFVMFAGANGDTVNVAPAVTDGTVPYEYMVGITTEEIPADGFGFVTQFGFVNQVNTSAYTIGTLLYPDPANPGGFVSSQPAAPAFNTAIAAVTKSHANTGRVLVRMTNGVTLDNVHDVQITNPSDGQVLMYDTVNHIWVNGDAAGGSSLTVSDSLPENPEVGDQWYNSGDGVTYVFYDGFWVESSSGGQETSLDGYATEQYVDDAIAAIPPTDLTGYATETYVNTAVSNLVDSAPSTLDTLNELAAALGDDANFATTVTTALGNKQDKISGVSDTEIGYLDGVTSSIQTQIDSKMPKIQAVSDKSAGYTLQASDANTLIRSTGSAIIITVPDVLENGHRVDFIQAGAGQITFSGSGVSILSADSKLLTAKQYAGATIFKAGGSYYLIGNLA